MQLARAFYTNPLERGIHSDISQTVREEPVEAMVVFMKSISLKTAEAIADAAIHAATQKKWAPVTVVVLDSWGHTVVTKRMDGCSPVGP